MTSVMDDSVGVVRERWAARKIEAFDLMRPANISVVATDGPISVTTWSPNGEVKARFGHNRGVWPVKVASSMARRDTATMTYNKDPAYFLGTQFRVWARTPALRDALLETVVNRIAQQADSEGGLEPLLNGFHDVGPDFSLQLFELEIHDMARRLQMLVWDDAGLSRFLDRVLARDQQIIAGGCTGRFATLEVALTSELEALTGQAAREGQGR